MPVGRGDRGLLARTTQGLEDVRRDRERLASTTDRIGLSVGGSAAPDPAGSIRPDPTRSVSARETRRSRRRRGRRPAPNRTARAPLGSSRPVVGRSRLLPRTAGPEMRDVARIDVDPTRASILFRLPIRATSRSRPFAFSRPLRRPHGAGNPASGLWPASGVLPAAPRSRRGTPPRMRDTSLPAGPGRTRPRSRRWARPAGRPPRRPG